MHRDVAKSESMPVVGMTSNPIIRHLACPLSVLVTAKISKQGKLANQEPVCVFETNPGRKITKQTVFHQDDKKVKYYPNFT